MSGERLGMSEREYARHAGVSRGAVQKARSSGRLVLHPDGSVDVAASDARRAQATDPSKQRSHTPPGGLRPVPPPGFRPVPAAGFRPVPEVAVAAVGKTLKEQGLPAPRASAMRRSCRRVPPTRC